MKKPGEIAALRFNDHIEHIVAVIRKAIIVASFESESIKLLPEPASEMVVRHSIFYDVATDAKGFKSEVVDYLQLSFTDPADITQYTILDWKEANEILKKDGWWAHFIGAEIYVKGKIKESPIL